MVPTAALARCGDLYVCDVITQVRAAQRLAPALVDMCVCVWQRPNANCDARSRSKQSCTDNGVCPKPGQHWQQLWPSSRIEARIEASAFAQSNSSIPEYGHCSMYQSGKLKERNPTSGVCLID